MNHAHRRLLLSAFFCLSLGCSKSEPTFDVLDSSSIPQPRFAGATEIRLTAANDGQTFSIHGQCDVKITSILAKIVKDNAIEGPLSAVTVSSPIMRCQTDGTFSMELKSLEALGITAEEGKTYQIQLRGVTIGGTSRASTIKVTYVTPNGNGPRRMTITSGGTESGIGLNAQPRIATSANFKAVLRVDHRENAGADTGLTQSSANFKAKIGVAADVDTQ